MIMFRVSDILKVDTKDRRCISGSVSCKTLGYNRRMQHINLLVSSLLMVQLFVNGFGASLGGSETYKVTFVQIP